MYFLEGCGCVSAIVKVMPGVFLGVGLKGTAYILSRSEGLMDRTSIAVLKGTITGG